MGYFKTTLGLFSRPPAGGFLYPFVLRGTPHTAPPRAWFSPLVLDDDVLTQAYFDAKCAGDDGDWADLAYDNL